MLFKSLKELYFEDMGARLRENTVKSKINVVDNKILPYFENMPLDEIKPATIRKWQSEILSQGFSPSYLKYINAQLSAIFNFGMKYYELKENPCLRAGSMGSTKTKDIDFWTLDEYKDFINHPNEKYVMAFKVLYWTGMI